MYTQRTVATPNPPPLYPYPMVTPNYSVAPIHVSPIHLSMETKCWSERTHQEVRGWHRRLTNIPDKGGFIEEKRFRCSGTSVLLS